MGSGPRGPLLARLARQPPSRPLPSAYRPPALPSASRPAPARGGADWSWQPPWSGGVPTCVGPAAFLGRGVVLEGAGL